MNKILKAKQSIEHFDVLISAKNNFDKLIDSFVW